MKVITLEMADDDDEMIETADDDMMMMIMILLFGHCIAPQQIGFKQWRRAPWSGLMSHVQRADNIYPT